MKIAVITDIHDNLINLSRAVNSINFNEEIEIVILCGDIGHSSEVIDYLSKLTKRQYVALSSIDIKNNDLFGYFNNSAIDCFSPFGKIEVDGRKIGFTHEEKYAKEQKGFDVIFYGHWHRYETKIVNGTLFVCCGELEERKIRPCYVVYDTDTNEVEKVDV